MAARVTSEEVLAILPNAPSTLTDLTVYITPANLLVNRLALSDCGSELLDTELKEVERQLAAHYTSVSNPGLSLQAEDFEGAKNVYSRGATKNAMGIMSTQFGQMANTMSGGCLVRIDKQKASGFASAGGDYTE